ncbi:4Fe-4S binding protein [Candidatus Latescibacterota bacterium]
MILGRIKRIWWQITGVIIFNIPFIGPNHFAFLPIPVLNCYACPLAQGACPIGTIQHFFVIGAIPFLAIGAVGIFGLIAGRFYCSHLCPFGFFQDLIGRISKKKYLLPHWAGYGKYVSLVLLVIIIPPIVKEPFFCTLCPAGTLEAGIPIVSEAWYQSEFGSADIFGSSFGIMSMIGWWFWLKIGILAGLIGLTFVSRRPFCRTACPLGALLGLFNRISSLVHPPAEKQQSGKGYYLKDCPVHINRPHDVDSHNCIKCKECYNKPD